VPLLTTFQKYPTCVDGLRVTATLEASALGLDRPSLRSVRRQWRSAMEHGAVLLGTACFLFVVTPASGGRERTDFAIGVVSLLPALAATAPWRRVGRLALAMPCVLALSGAVVMLTTPMGWSNCRYVGYALYGVLAFLVVAAYATTATRRMGVAITLCLAGLLQFEQAFTPWWGNNNPQQLMWGTFYWHNQFGAYMVGCGVLAMALAVYGTSLMRVVGLAGTAITGAGIVFSTSRTSLGLLIVAWLAVAPLAFRAGRRHAVIAWFALPVLVAAAVMALTSPLVFPDRSYHFFLLPHSGAAGRGLGTIDTNGGARLDFARAALALWKEHPLTGTGFGAFGTASVDHMPAGVGLSAFPHNGFLNALSSGGILYGAPVILGSLFMALVFLRNYRRSLKVTARERAVTMGTSVAGLALLSHVAVDFDWTYPSLCALLGAIFGLSYALRDRSPLAKTIQPARASAAVGIVALVLPLCFAAGTAMHDRWHHSFVAATRNPDLAVNRMLDAAGGPLSDPVLSASALVMTTRSDHQGVQRLVVRPSTARRALDATAELATLDPTVAMSRAITLVALGDDQQGLTLASDLVHTYASHRPYLIAKEAMALATADRHQDARHLLLTGIAGFLQKPANADAAWGTLSALQDLDGASPDPQTACAYSDAVRVLGSPPATVADMPNAESLCRQTPSTG